MLETGALIKVDSGKAAVLTKSHTLMLGSTCLEKVIPFCELKKRFHLLPNSVPTGLHIPGEVAF